MKIGVMADSHDRFDGVARAIEIFKAEQVDMIVHCGDWIAPLAFTSLIKQLGDFKPPIKAVFGNNDAETARIYAKNVELGSPVEFSLTSVLEIEIDGELIVAYHGQDTVVLNALIGCGNYRAIFSGHTHQVRNEVVNDTLVLNPGATCFYVGFEVVDAASVAIYDSESNTAEIRSFGLRS